MSSTFFDSCARATTPPHYVLTTHLVTGIKAKVENQAQYDEYIEELKPIRDELGVNLKEALYPESS